MKRYISLILLLMLALPLLAQKKEIAAARDLVAKGSSLDKAEQSMLTLLNDSANRENPKIWLTMFEALQKQYEQGNEKLYLKQQYDTTALFNTASRMFTQMEAFDSIDARPDKKGRVRPVYRKQHAELLHRLRPNLFNGGVFLIRKQQWTEAYQLLNQYIEAADKPLFASYRYHETDPRMAEAAFWAVYSAYKMGDSRRTLHHTYLALKDTAHYERMLQYLSETYKRDDDTCRYVTTLSEGFRRYPCSPYFYAHLLDHYSSRKDYDAALRLTDAALLTACDHRNFWIAKSSLLLNMGDYAGSYRICDSLLQHRDTLPVGDTLAVGDTIAVPDTMPEVLLNAGLAKFNQGVLLDKVVQKTERQRRQIQKLYRQALPYLEDYRRRRPDNKDKWGLPLYTIYLNLNMGKEFDEIDRIIK